MARFEYMAQHWSSPIIGRGLDERGLYGWELVSVTAESPGYTLWFKRPAQRHGLLGFIDRMVDRLG